MSRPALYTKESVQFIEATLRETGSINKTRRIVAEYKGPWSKAGPSKQKVREILANAHPPITLTDEGGRPDVYSEAQKMEMTRLAKMYGITGDNGAIAIIAAPSDSKLAAKRDLSVFPDSLRVSQPTILAARKVYGKD